ncbi:Two-component oxygen-sensor histidine kinase FixL [Hyphomicrobium sulfonivorans]|uniref:histidine kinase n=1 Tax=Hyphomicrobium sulfonivorans TaxID=121290 RepID=A0A125NTQ8_HYPSL|nr:ATP-binding protein [Hyphomicrobium sulfonivorans]KWT64215.1 Two-component oxygen-sensor histidine kinase FixL [Hyphomicrobium sulfonivorans]
MITVSVRDWGNGVPDTVASQLFSPFVSTKESAMGMGLTICRSIIELHGGHIEYLREPDGGSRFTIILPTADRAANE